MVGKIEDFVEKAEGKTPVVLLNFPLQVEEGTLVAKIETGQQALVEQIRTRIWKELLFLLLADDKSHAIRQHSTGVHHDATLNRLRRAYYQRNKAPEGLWIEASEIYTTERWKLLFSELKLWDQSKLAIANPCAKAYHHLLFEVIDRQRFVLISLIPAVCQMNLAEYLQSQTVDDGVEEQGISVQNIFYNVQDGAYKIIEV